MRTLERLGQRPKVDPQVVGVVVAPAAKVAEGLLVLGWGLRHLAQDQLPVRAAAGDVAALAVGLRPPDDLHHERDPVGREMRRHPRVELRPEVVGVGDHRVLESALEQRGEHPRTTQRAVNVAVPGRAPLERRRRRPADRRQRLGVELRDHALQEVKRESFDGELGVAVERCARRLMCRLAVHEHER